MKIARQKGGGQPITPITIRIPRAGERCPFTGLTRSAIYRLIEQGVIETIEVKQPGAKRGIRLIDFESLARYLLSLSDQDTAGGENHAERCKADQQHQTFTNTQNP